MTCALHPTWDNNVLYGPTSSGLEDEREVEYLNKGGKEIRNKNRHDNSLKYKVTKKGVKYRFAGYPLPQWSSSLRISRAMCSNLIRRAGTPCGGHFWPFHIGCDPRFIQRETSEVLFSPAGSCSQAH